MAKKLKIKLPKRIAGVKIPKAIRKGPIAQFLNSGAGQVILAETLVAASGVFAAAKTDPESTVGDAVRHPIESARAATSGTKRSSAEQAGRVSFALQEALRAFRAAMEQEAPDHADWNPGAREAEADEPDAKKRSARSATTPH